MIFDEAFLEELKQRNNIVSVIGKYIPLEKKGRNYWGRCPFHLEKTPSFCVNEVDQFYHCFGCKAGGTVIQFVMNMESVPFADAVRILAENCGMELPRENDRSAEEYAKMKQEKEEMVRCMKDCAKHYYDNLQRSPIAKEYLKNRRISPEMINRFGIGYSVDYTEIINFLKSKGYTKELMKKVGIIKEKDGRFYDAIGERIAFPVINLYGEVVAFSGRTMQKNPEFAKYLNTAETPLFSKSRNLFGINLVKKFKQQNGLNEIIIVEGQVDVIALHQAGYGNALASLGTALTQEQARMIKRLSDNVIICYDGDFAGTKATMRGLDILKQENLNVRVASLPDGKDPDEVIKEFGKGAFDRVIQNALPLVEYKLKALSKEFNLAEFDGKAKYVDEAIKVLSDIKDTEAEVYLDYIKGLSGVNKDFLRNKLADASLKLNSGSLIKPLEHTPKDENKTQVINEAEMCVLANLLRKKEYAKVDAALGRIFTGEARDIFEYLTKNSPSVQECINHYSECPEKIGGIVNFVFSEDETTNTQQFNDCLWQLYKNNLLKRQQELMKKVSNVSGDERKSIMQELIKISQQLNSRRIED